MVAALRSNPFIREAAFVYIIESNLGYVYAAQATNACKEPPDSPYISIFMTSGNDALGRPGVRITGEDKQRFVNQVAYFLEEGLLRVWGERMVSITRNAQDSMHMLESQLLAFRRVEAERSDLVWSRERVTYSGKMAGKDDLVSALGLVYFAVRFLGDRRWTSQVPGLKGPVNVKGYHFVKELWDKQSTIPQHMYEQTRPAQ
ncbi:MAG: hypothetical protein KF742_01685 [Cryobacterium sp.]|nr:hypothetical protein [Cryobacterium sp.]